MQTDAPQITPQSEAPHQSEVMSPSGSLEDRQQALAGALQETLSDMARLGMENEAQALMEGINQVGMHAAVEAEALRRMAEQGEQQAPPPHSSRKGVVGLVAGALGAVAAGVASVLAGGKEKKVQTAAVAAVGGVITGIGAAMTVKAPGTPPAMENGITPENLREHLAQLGEMQLQQIAALVERGSELVEQREAQQPPEQPVVAAPPTPKRDEQAASRHTPQHGKPDPKDPENKTRAAPAMHGDALPGNEDVKPEPVRTSSGAHHVAASLSAQAAEASVGVGG